jgi:hypothetical protein
MANKGRQIMKSKIEQLTGKLSTDLEINDFIIAMSTNEEFRNTGFDVLRTHLISEGKSSCQCNVKYLYFLSLCNIDVLPKS